jgi:hypothetical protein
MAQRDWTLAENKPLVEADIAVLRTQGAATDQLIDSLALKADESMVTSSLALKADRANPTFTGTVALPATSAVTLNGVALSTYLPSVSIGTMTFSTPVNVFNLNITFSPACASADYTVVWDVSSGWLQVANKSATRAIIVGRDWNGTNIDFTGAIVMSFVVLNAAGVVTHRMTRGTFAT